MKTTILTLATLLAISSLSFAKTEYNEALGDNDNVDIYLNAFDKGSMPSVSDIVDENSKSSYWKGTIITTAISKYKIDFDKKLNNDEQEIHTFNYGIEFKKDVVPLLNRLSFTHNYRILTEDVPHLVKNLFQSSNPYSYEYSNEYASSELFFNTKAKVLKTTNAKRQFRIYGRFLVFKDEAGKDGFCANGDDHEHTSKPSLKKYKNLCSVGVLRKDEKY